MTNLERFKGLFIDMGIGFTEAGFPMIGGVCKDPQQIHLTLAPGLDKVEGYPGFETVFRFTLDGGFIDVGVWE